MRLRQGRGQAVRVLLGLALLIGGAVANGGEEIAPVRRVLVFDGLAEVEREGVVQIKAGANVIAIEGLPYALDETSLRVVAEAPGVTVGRVEVEPVRKRLVREEEALEVRKSSEELQERIQLLTARAGRLEERYAFLRSLRIQPPPHDPDKAPPPLELSPASWINVLDFVDEGMKAASEERAGIRKEIEAATIDLEVLTTRLERLASKEVKAYKNAHIHLTAPADAACPLRVSYRVAGPAWYPRYEIRADAVSGTVKLVAYALVRQETGEDWTDVELSVSTVDLRASADLPRPAAERISPEGVILAGDLGGKPVLSDVPVVGRFTRSLKGGREIVLSAQLEEAPQGAYGMGDRFQVADADTGGIEGEKKKDWYFARARERSEEQRRSIDEIQNRLSGLSARGYGYEAAKPMPAGKAGQVRIGDDASGDASVTVQAAEEDKSALYRERNARIRELYQKQDAAKKSRNYDEYAQYNDEILENWKTLPQQQQKALSALQQDAEMNRAEAQRLIVSRRLSDGLVSPRASVRGVDYRFAALGPARVHSDGTLARVPYIETELKADFVYETAPVLDPTAYLVATAKNALAQPLLSGPSAVFVGPDFIGEGRIGVIASGEELRFDLGIDREVEVRHRFDRDRDTRGFWGSEYRYTYGVTTTVVNRRARAVRVRVIDRVPYALKDAGVEIYDVTAKPAPAEKHMLKISETESVEDGLMEWMLDLAPDTEGKVELGYGMRYRTTLRVVGDERGEQW